MKVVSISVSVEYEDGSEWVYKNEYPGPSPLPSVLIQGELNSIGAFAVEAANEKEKDDV